MILLAFIFLLFFLVQIFLAISGWATRAKLEKKYSYFLGSQHEVSKLIEYYTNEFPELRIIVSSDINEIAYSDENLLIMNKKYIYSKDLFSNFYTLAQLELTKHKNKPLRDYYIKQNVLFYLQLIIFIVGICIQSVAEYILILAIALQLVTILMTFFLMNDYKNFLYKVAAKAKTTLKLDPVEMARTEALVEDIKYEVFEYPFEILWRLSHFLRK